jgi:protein gp37
MAHRFSGRGMPYERLTRSSSNGPRWTGQIRFVADVIEEPLRWRRPRLVFVNSMSDLFHEGVREDSIKEIFETMERAHWHTFQILTKRADRLAEVAPNLRWPPNVWMGVSVESQDYLWRIEQLRKVPAAVRFVSMEPLLGPLPSLSLKDIHWVIVGGESGPHSRPMQEVWVREILRQCRDASVPFFFKQWGGVRKKQQGRLLDGRIYDEMPEFTKAGRLRIQ